MSGRTTWYPATCFNTQPPEGGWLHCLLAHTLFPVVSTHSRLKAAGNASKWRFDRAFVSTHSRLKAAGPMAARS